MQGFRVLNGASYWEEDETKNGNCESTGVNSLSGLRFRLERFGFGGSVCSLGVDALG